MKLLLENWRRYLSESQEDVESMIQEIKFNSTLALSVFRDDSSLLEIDGERAFEYEVSLAENPNHDVVQKFNDSLYGGERIGFLSPYSIDKLRMMDLHKIKGHNAGFAIKDGDDIVSVHNNSDLKGLASEFMRKAKELGGVRLDHFDGFLSGFYRKHGFVNVHEIYQWNEQYAPKEWIFEDVNVLDSKTSVYSESLGDLIFDDPSSLPNEKIEVVAEGGLKLNINPFLKYNSYKYGRPDIIMRKLG